MFSRKHPPPAKPPTERDEDTKTKEAHITFVHPQFKFASSLIVFIIFWLLLFFFWFPRRPTDPLLKTHITKNIQEPAASVISTVPAPVCHGSVSVYMYELPPEFNSGLLKDCRNLNVYTDMCPHVANSGLGQPIPDMTGQSSSTSWFATHQFIAEMIFHARVANHPCRTRDPSLADVFYVPFYGGLHASSKFREPDLKARDDLAIKLIKYLRRQPWWARNHGRDHFLALGRTAWDFMRTSDVPDFGANSLLNLPPVKNMSVLTVERHPWQGSNQYGIPYPSYFHPLNFNEMLTWQKKVTLSERPYLFSFIGGPRKGVEKAAIRDEILSQCAESTHCKLLICGKGASKCHEPSEVLDVMTKSQFCLQAPGDSFTRRSTFDSVLAGCIPVFFSPHTAYSQYTWFLPANRSTYSVYIDGEGSERKSNVEEELLKILPETVERMRGAVIDLIPTLTYAHPNTTDYQFRDAVDVALAALSELVKSKLQLQT